MTGPLVKSMAEAADVLGKPFTVDFLKGHLDTPHVAVRPASP